MNETTFSRLSVLTAMSVALLMSLAGTVEAGVVVDLEPPATCCVGEMYHGQWATSGTLARSFFFEDVEAFELVSAGMELDLAQAMPITVELYEVSGVDTIGPMLTNNQATFTDEGRAWYDIPLSYTFTGSGNRYLMLFEWASQTPESRFWSFEGRGDYNKPIDPPYTAGPVRVIDGASTLTSNDTAALANHAFAHFRLEVVPEPSTLVLLMVSGVLMCRRVRV